MSTLPNEQEESLREACGIGDSLTVQTLLSQGVDVNSQNAMNGWTALHWATHRGHSGIVAQLIKAGANTTITNNKDQLAVALAKDTAVAEMLGGEITNGSHSHSELPITPNYISNPPFPHVKPGGSTVPYTPTQSEASNGPTAVINSSSELVLKTRVANAYETDFIEVELKHSALTYESLVTLLCTELGVNPELVVKVRKLPNTIVRKDKDVARLVDYQEMELVLTNKATQEMTSRVYDTPKPQPGNIVY